LSTLQVLGSVGEPINPEAWHWYHKVIGHEKCSIVDTFWQTETGGHVLTPLPGCTPMKPGSAVGRIKIFFQQNKILLLLLLLLSSSSSSSSSSLFPIIFSSTAGIYSPRHQWQVHY